jgi:hypothetical protein
VSGTASFIARTSSSRFRDALAVAAIALIAVALWMPRLAGPLDLRFDAGVYYILGTSLAAGQGYRLTNEPGAIEAIQYPPLLPLFAAAHQRLLGTDDPAVAGHALRWSYAALFVAYAVAVYALARRFLGHGWALVAGLLVLLHMQLTWLSDLLFAELPFALCTVLFLLSAHRGARRGVPGLLAGATYLLRSAGLAVFVGWVADALLRRRFRAALVRGLIALLPVLAWQIHVTRVQQSPDFRRPAYEYQRAPYQYYNVSYAANMSYVDSFAPERGTASPAELLGRVIANVGRLPVALGASASVDVDWLRGAIDYANQRWSAAIPRDVATLLFVLLGLVAVAGQCVLLARGERLLPLYWFASLGLIVLTPWELQFGRYLMPLAPVTVIGVVTAIALVARTSRTLGAMIAAGTGAVLVTQALVLALIFARQHTTVAAGTQRLFFYDDAWAKQDRAIAWLGQEGEPDAIVATSTPYRLHIATGLRAVLPPFEASAAEAERLLDGVPVEYLVIDDLGFVDVTRRYAAPVIATFPHHWSLVHGSPTSGARIYRRVRGE